MWNSGLVVSLQPPASMASMCASSPGDTTRAGVSTSVDPWLSKK